MKKEKPHREFHMSYLFCPAAFGISYLEKKKTQHHLKQKLPTYPNVYRGTRFYPDFVSSNHLAEVQFHTPAEMLTSNSSSTPQRIAFIEFSAGMSSLDLTFSHKICILKSKNLKF